jgi:predicted dehydrogenase
MATPFSVGFVFGAHPHTIMHSATLRLLDEVTAVHLCPLEGDDPAPVAAAVGEKARPAVSLDALLSGMPRVDALIVSVPNNLCSQILERAIGAGIPVLFEKPGATSATTLWKLAAQAREKKLTLGTILAWRYHPISQQVRALVEQGALGRLLAVEARMITSQVRYRDPSHWLFDPEVAGSGILSWLGVHWLDLLVYLTGQRVKRVTALAGSVNPEKVAVEDAACLALEYADGTLGTLQAGYLLPGSTSGYSGAAYDNFVALRGYEGWVTWPMTASPGTYTHLSMAGGHETKGAEERRVETPPSQAYSGAHGLEFVRDFLHAARAGKPAPCPIEDMAHVLGIVEAALKAAQTGQTQRVGA